MEGYEGFLTRPARHQRSARLANLCWRGIAQRLWATGARQLLRQPASGAAVFFERTFALSIPPVPRYRSRQQPVRRLKAYSREALTTMDPGGTAQHDAAEDATQLPGQTDIVALSPKSLPTGGDGATLQLTSDQPTAGQFLPVLVPGQSSTGNEQPDAPAPAPAPAVLTEPEVYMCSAAYQCVHVRERSGAKAYTFRPSGPTDLVNMCDASHS